MDNPNREAFRGSFLWAALMIGEISRSIHEGAAVSEADENMNHVPVELKLLYDREVKNIIGAAMPDDIFEFRRILSVLAVQQESMHLSVLAEALQGVSPQTPLAPERVGDLDADYMHRIEVLITALMPLVTNRSGYVTLVHGSLREYLLRTDDSECSKLTRINFNQANADIALRCVAVIHQNVNAIAGPGDLDDLGHGFSGYAARNWTAHFHVGQELVDEKYIKLASDLFRTDEFPVTWWLTLYEKATTEKTPRCGILSPLFGGAYFGLTPVVKRALEVGCDINAVDDDAKTSLHWACERGHVDVAVLLIRNGANLFSQSFDGRTALHFAAQNSHAAMVKQLLDFGLSPDSTAFDGRTALHIAVEANNTEIAEVLLDTGADATKKTTSDFNAFHLACQSTTQRMLKFLMGFTAASERLLSKAITENLSDMVDLLIIHRLDVVESRYPWVVVLIDEGLPSKEISSLLLQSENLQWIDSEEWPPQSKRMWSDLPLLTHQKGCAHQVINAVFGSPGLPSSSRLAEEKGDQSSKGGTSLKYFSEHDSHVILPDAFLEPVEFFDRLEQREQRLLHMCGIGGVYPPWYAAFNPGSMILLASQARVMYGGTDSVRSPERQRGEMATSDVIAHLCSDSNVLPHFDLSRFS